MLIEDRGSEEEKIYLRTKILNKKIDKTIKVKKETNTKKFNDKIIKVISIELVNIIKAQNLIDVKVPSFLNAKLIRFNIFYF